MRAVCCLLSNLAFFGVFVLLLRRVVVGGFLRVFGVLKILWSYFSSYPVYSLLLCSGRWRMQEGRQELWW
ncbi:hypothetical protein K432DRAFT_195374 [Lepidopterella palustris CBS 459.81]|uniref:Transmembrane protein n=1 Tax=Lepidopterella palustris CBS 459.81 TaxID=1314670 RepID=A0A8E2EFY2_9PEZI|nr:hypothetical protein K432DRAFT_195374 [Lepidopterella palustris CBS 459.81]